MRRPRGIACDTCGEDDWYLGRSERDGIFSNCAHCRNRRATEKRAETKRKLDEWVSFLREQKASSV